MTALTDHTATTSIATTTSLSVLLHAAVVVAVLSIDEEGVVEQAVGEGISIELVSSEEVADQIETDSAQRQQAETVKPSEMLVESVPQKSVTDTGSDEGIRRSALENVLHVNDKEPVLVTTDSRRDESSQQDITDMLEVSETETQKVDVEEFDVEKVNADILDAQMNEAQAMVNRSTDASQQQHSILELLHSRISNEKVYPYLARRQRREGTTTIAFVLYPDGRVEQARLINSSQTAALDRAAISAVKDIEPFHAARDYLQHAQRFQVDVVFSLL